MTTEEQIGEGGDVIPQTGLLAVEEKNSEKSDWERTC